MSKKIISLVVDDDFSCRKLLEMILTPYGSCQAAEDGAAALLYVKEQLRIGNHFDLICLDIMMPGMDGQTVLKEIRKLEEEQNIMPGEGAKIIMVSALNDPKSIMTAFKEQSESYLVKPIDKAQVAKELIKLKLLDPV